MLLFNTCNVSRYLKAIHLAIFCVCCIEKSEQTQDNRWADFIHTRHQTPTAGAVAYIVSRCGLTLRYIILPSPSYFLFVLGIDKWRTVSRYFKGAIELYKFIFINRHNTVFITIKLLFTQDIKHQRPVRYIVGRCGVYSHRACLMGQ